VVLIVKQELKEQEFFSHFIIICFCCC